MTAEYDEAFSRHELPELYLKLSRPPIEGAGKTGEDRVRAAPAVPCAIVDSKAAHEHTGSAGASRPSLRNGFTAYFELFPENGSFASVARKMLSLPADLTPAPRRQNHTTSPYASAALVCRGIGVHRISPRVSDDGQRPSSRGETAVVMPVIWGKREAKNFRLSEIIGLTGFPQIRR
jgi:hypothetical protein